MTSVQGIFKMKVEFPNNPEIKPAYSTNIMNQAKGPFSRTEDRERTNIDDPEAFITKKRNTRNKPHRRMKRAKIVKEESDEEPEYPSESENEIESDIVDSEIIGSDMQEESEIFSGRLSPVNLEEEREEIVSQTTMSPIEETGIPPSSPEIQFPTTLVLEYDYLEQFDLLGSDMYIVNNFDYATEVQTDESLREIVDNWIQ
jgi:hypothetical protein